MIIQTMKFILCSVSFFLLPFLSVAHAEEFHVDGGFQISASADGVQIKPQLQANETIDLRYKVTINKCGVAGTSRHANAGLVQLIKNEKKNVGTTVAFQNFTDTDHVSMTLEVFKNKALLATFTKEYPSSTHCG